MIQNMLITGLTPLNNKSEINSWENQPFSVVWPEKIQAKVKDITRTIKKKPKRVRTAFSTEQIRSLERAYSRYKYISADRRNVLAKTLNIGEKCIKIWFQNRRMKEKRESSESGCDSSSESFGSETTSVTASPPPEVKPACSSQQPYCNNSEYLYQLPTFYGMDGANYNSYGVQPHNIQQFYNDNSVYPTQYYPMDMNNTNVDGSCYNGGNQYGNEMSNYWMSNEIYYAPVQNIF